MCAVVALVQNVAAKRLLPATQIRITTANIAKPAHLASVQSNAAGGDKVGVGGGVPAPLRMSSGGDMDIMQQTEACNRPA
mmetsp:Transcript_21221/g.73087  ORF Transcript_21221/g.73087 Transcript_21221/m.73087 type:complete len:80 (+) Transcript_21221:196-435(+)